ncbi:DUF7502 family protein [Halorarius halobius]|uniref:DUF7502 family protein n=1 Tax=Halorarius halobius TaxID=2962671 RepID=UPI0020CE100B|nr:hypothetical protein [Halorarius halobius]
MPRVDADGGVVVSEDVPADPAERRARVQEAVTAVRREGVKAAVLYAVVDGAVAVLVANLLLSAANGVPVVGGFPERAFVAAGVGLLVLLVELGVRIRRPLVERFEEANPEVAEALRTARDAADAGLDSQVANRLYADVLSELRAASSRGLLDGRRLAGTVVVAVAVAAVTVQATVAGITVAAPPAPAPDGGGVGDAPPDDDYGGLQDGDAVLGTPTNVSEGSQNESASVGGQAGDGERSGGIDESYDTGGYAGEGAYEAQRAGFSESDDVANADIIREYNLEIRDDDD